MTCLEIGEIKIGDNYTPQVIAEIGINHNGSLKDAIKLADAAIDAGAKLIKHQTHVVEDEMSEEAQNIIPDHASESIYDIMKKCALGEEDEFKLMSHIEGRGAIFISTPFSREALNRLIKFDVKAIKIGSGECNNHALVDCIAKAGKPIIMSTGMNTIESISKSVDVIRDNNVPFALLHCTNVYPTPPELVRLGAMIELKDAFPDALIGLSDHTTSNHTCFGAIALGACIVERHFTDDMARKGPDIINSMDPKALVELIEGVDIIAKARGGGKTWIPEEQGTRDFAFVSVVATKDILEGDQLSPNNIWVRRPGGGDYNVDDLNSLYGLTAHKSIKNGTQIKKSQLKLS